MTTPEFPSLSRAEHGTFFLLFAALAAVYSFPLLTDLDMMPVGDGYLNAHGFWWFKTALSSFKNPFYTDYFFYPRGANLAFYGGAVFSDFILTLPVSFLVGVNEAVNVAHFLNYLLCGYCTFLLAHELTEDKRSAVVAGIIFAFVPYHFSLVPTIMTLSALQWLPLYLLMFKRAMASKNIKWSILAGLSMAAIILTEQMQTIMAVLVTVAAVPILIFRIEKVENRKRIRTIPDASGILGRLFLAVIVAAAASSFYLYPVVEFLLHSSDALKIDPFGHGGANRYSADLLGFIVPPAYHPIWGKWLSPIGSQLFLGYLPLSLAVIGFIKNRSNKTVRFVAVISLSSLLLSLGTTLHLNGAWEWNGMHIKLPFYYLSDLPLFSSIRTPDRFHPLTVLGVALLASFGAVHILACDISKHWGKGITIILSSIIVLEFLPGPTGYVEAHPVAKIYQEMALDKEPYTILELPLARWSSTIRNGAGDPNRMMYRQSVHGKKVFSGILGRASFETLMFYDELISELLYVSYNDKFVITGREKRTASPDELAKSMRKAKEWSSIKDSVFARNNIRYVVVHAPIAYPGSLTTTFVETLCGQPMKYVPEDNLAYIKIDPAKP